MNSSEPYNQSRSPIRTAFIGAGYRGKQLMGILRYLPGFQVVAVADPSVDASDVAPMACYNSRPESYLEMLDEQKPDLVFIASPWQWHVQHALQCVARGCHVALEIKGGLYLREYQPLLELAKQRSCRIYPLENTLFLREVLALHEMVAAGVLGELVYMRGGYRHDLRSLLLDDNGHIGNRAHTESVWRSRFYLRENADLYPTHGLAPLCLIGGINRTDRFLRLSAVASKAAGLLHRVRQLGGPEQVSVLTGDIVATQIETANGLLISLTHDTTLPRPRSLDFEAQGTKGIWQGEHRRIYLEGISPYETWEEDAPYLAQYDHPYWRQWGEEAVRCDTHHRGMDYIMLKALEADWAGLHPYPANGSDLALWTSVTPWSAASIRMKKAVKCEP